LDFGQCPNTYHSAAAGIDDDKAIVLTQVSTVTGIPNADPLHDLDVGTFLKLQLSFV
jgi:hypothetical protein